MGHHHFEPNLLMFAETNNLPEEHPDTFVPRSQPALTFTHSLDKIGSCSEKHFNLWGRSRGQKKTTKKKRLIRGKLFLLPVTVDQGRKLEKEAMS